MVVEIAFKENLPIPFGNDSGSCFQECFPGTIVKSQADQPRNVGLGSF